jgi:hypothetical protein
MFESQRDGIYFKGDFYIPSLWDSTMFGHLEESFYQYFIPLGLIILFIYPK